MATYYQAITVEQEMLIKNANLFFVGSADPALIQGPEGVGPVNISPKGGVPLHVLSPSRVAYLDYCGSGNETARHAINGGPVTVMICSFEEEDPAVVRLYGKATVSSLENLPTDGLLRNKTADEEIGLDKRQVITIDIESTATSCGYGVPVLDYVKQRNRNQRGNAYKGSRRNLQIQTGKDN